MTVAWLDQARYADTNGFSIGGGRHMWVWADWVIHVVPVKILHVSDPNRVGGFERRPWDPELIVRRRCGMLRATVACVRARPQRYVGCQEMLEKA